LTASSFLASVPLYVQEESTSFGAFSICWNLIYALFNEILTEMSCNCEIRGFLQILGNMAFASLLLLYKGILYVFFGTITMAETQVRASTSICPGVLTDPNRETWGGKSTRLFPEFLRAITDSQLRFYFELCAENVAKAG
jgi:hypothetical protein